MQTHSDSFQRYGQHEIHIDVLLYMLLFSLTFKKLHLMAKVQVKNLEEPMNPEE